MAVAPLPLALIVCDHVRRDAGTGKWTLTGTFSAIDIDQFPAALPEMAVYLALTGARGKIPISIRLIDSAEVLTDAIVTAEFRLEFPDPIAIIETGVVLRDVVFPFPGEYRLQLFARGHLVIERRIVVTNPASE